MKKKSKKKLLVIGGTGFIGYHLLKYAIKLGWKCYSISRNQPKKKRKVKKVKYFFFDIRIKKKFTNKVLKEYNYIVNLSDIQLNHLNLFLENKPGKFLHVGSSAEYGNLKKQPLKESSICKPVSKYGKKKLKITKNLIKKFERNFFPLIIIRLFQIYGSNDYSNKIVPFAIKNCLKDKKFKITLGYQTRDFSHIDDIIRAIILLLKSNKKIIFGKIFNIGSGKDIKIKDLVIKIKKIIGKGKPNFGQKKMRKNEIIISKPSIKKVKDYVNWQPKISLEDGIKNLVLNEK